MTPALKALLLSSRRTSFVLAGSSATTGLIPPPGYATGDFILEGALQTTDNTIPTVPAGGDWLTIAADGTHVISVQGAAAAGMFAYKFADEVEAGGVFTSAQCILCGIYRGISRSAPILYSNMLAGTVSPVSYPALNGGADFSEPCWVVLMNRTQNVVTVPTPAGFPDPIDTGSRRAILHSGGPINSFAQSDQTVTTPGKWITAAIAIKKA
jgi:hypothetical protein